MALTTAQVLLLNNLMYMTDTEAFSEITSYAQKGPESIRDIVESFDCAQLNGSTEYSTFTTGDDWYNLIQAIKSDETLMDVQLVSTHVDHAEGGGGGVSALFLDPSTNEAVVVFKGTQGGNEWKDNFAAGAQSSSAQQENALEWYQTLELDQYDSITVSGHSKGGNKAQYVTIMDNSVDRCLSFDGQGFSDEFIESYGDQIIHNQDKIQNHVVDYDIVNLLLNHVGETIYYEGQGIGNLLENHCPDSFFEFHEDGSYSLHTTDRPEEMAALDQFLNSYLRSLPENEKKELLGILGEVAQFSGGGTEAVLSILLAGDNEDKVAKLIAYVLEYEQKYPEFSNQMESLLERYGLGDISAVIDFASDVMDTWWFDYFLAGAGFVLANLPDWIVDWIQKYLKKKGISLTEEQLEQLLGMIQTVSKETQNVHIHEDGADKEAAATAVTGAVALTAGIASMRQMSEEIYHVYTKTERCGSALMETGKRTQKEMQLIGTWVIYQSRHVTRLAEKCRKLSAVLQEATQCYEETERNCSYVN